MFQIPNECAWDVMIFLSFSDVFNTGNEIDVYIEREHDTEKQIKKEKMKWNW